MNQVMNQVKIDKSEKLKEVMEVAYGKKKFSIPLANSLSVKEVGMLRSQEGVIEFLLKYIPEDIQDSMTFEELTQIIEGWSKASNLGES